MPTTTKKKQVAKAKAPAKPERAATKGDPITYRLDPISDEVMREMSDSTGLSVSELSRRAFEVFLMEVVRRKGMVGWILDEGISGQAATEYRKL